MEIYDALKVKADIDEVYVINNKDITAPKDYKDIVVKGDNHSNSLIFKMNSVLDGVDISDKNFEILYINADGYSDIVSVDAVSCTENYILFSWLLDSNVTAASGEVSFIVIITGNNYVWKSKPSAFKVVDTLDMDINSPEYTSTWVQNIEDKLLDLADSYVKKETGKGLSANDFTNELLTKINSIENGASKNYKHYSYSGDTINKVISDIDFVGFFTYEAAIKYTNKVSGYVFNTEKFNGTVIEKYRNIVTIEEDTTLHYLRYKVTEQEDGTYSGALAFDKKIITDEVLNEVIKDYYTKEDVESSYVKKEDGKGLFSGNYEDLTNKPDIPEAYDDTEINEMINNLGQNISGLGSTVQGLRSATEAQFSNLETYKVPNTRKINNKTLSNDITLTADDVGAATQSDIDDAISSIPVTSINSTVGSGNAVTDITADAEGNLTVGKNKTFVEKDENFELVYDNADKCIKFIFN